MYNFLFTVLLQQYASRQIVWIWWSYYYYVLITRKVFWDNNIHSGQKCFIRVACSWSKMPMFWRAGMRKGGKPLPLALQYLIFMIYRPCVLNLVMISSLASKCQDFEVGISFFKPFYVMKLKTSKLKVLAFWSQWRYHYQIQITCFLYHKNQILKC